MRQSDPSHSADPPHSGFVPVRVTPRPSRRDVLKLGMVGVVGLAGLTACGAVPPKPDQSQPQLRGDVYSHGATGGGLKDTLEPYFPVTNPDIARCLQLYEPLLRWNAQYEIEPSVAESVTPNRDNTRWTIRLRDGVEFHHGKTLTPDDVMFSLAKVTDPKKPGSGGTELAKFLDLKNSKIVDPKTILLQLSAPYAVLDQLLAEYTVGILPTDFDVSHPVGTGPFTYQRFVPGQLSQFARFDNYWDGPAFVDELIIYDFADDAATGQRAAGGPGPEHRRPAELPGEHHRSAGCLTVDLRDRCLGAVHDAGRRRAVLRCAGAPGAADGRDVGDRVTADGSRGQFVYVDRPRRVVAVKTSAWSYSDAACDRQCRDLSYVALPVAVVAAAVAAVACPASHGGFQR